MTGISEDCYCSLMIKHFKLIYAYYNALQIYTEEMYKKIIYRTGENKMIDLLQLQKRVYQNKIAKGFNVTDVFQEFCFIYGELSETCDAYRKKKDDLGEELADVALYLIGLSVLLGINLEEEIMRKMEKNEKRKYENRNGVLTKVEE